MTRRLKLPFIPTNFSSNLKGVLRSVYEHLQQIDQQVTAVEQTISASTDYSGTDTVPPNPVSDLTVTGYGSYNALTWTNPDNNDISHVEIVFSRTDDVASAEPGIIVSPYPSTRVDHQNTDPELNYYYFIRAVDTAGNESDWSPLTSVTNFVLGADVPPPDALSIVGGWTEPDANVSWPAVDHDYLKGYRVIVLNANDTQRRVIPMVAGNDVSYTYTMNCDDWLSPTTEIKVRVHSVDMRNRISTNSVEQSFSLALPAAVTGLVAEISDLGFTLKWTPTESTLVTGYDVALDDVVLTQNQQGSIYLYETLLLVGDYAFKVRACDLFGRVSEWAQETVTVLAPEQPSSFRADVIDNTVLFYWQPPLVIHLPIVEYAISKGDEYATAEETPGRKKGSFTSYYEVNPGTHRYWIAAIDSAGNVGTPAELTATIAQPIDYELLVKWEDDFFGGVQTGVASTPLNTQALNEVTELLPTNVLIEPDGTAIAPYRTDESWAEHFTNNRFTTIQHFIDAGYTYLPEPVPTSAYYEEEHDYGAVLVQVMVTLSLDKRDYNGGPAVQPYIISRETLADDWLSKKSASAYVTNFQYIKDRYEFISDGHRFAVLNTHTLELGVKRMSEGGKSSVTDAQNGKTIAFSRDYIDIISLVATAKTTDQITTVVDFLDEPYPNDFTVYLFNATGDRVTGSFTWYAEGY